MQFIKEYGFGHLFDESIEKYRNSEAIVFKNWRLTYGNLSDLINRTANYFISLGLKKGDRVSLISKNRPEYLIVEFAMYKLGIIPVKMSWRLSEDVAYIISKNNGVKMLIIDGSILPNIKEILSKYKDIKYLILEGNSNSNSSLVNIVKKYSNEDIRLNFSKDDVACHICTSGSSGIPKTVVYTHYSAINKILDMYNASYRIVNNEISLFTNQLFHIASFILYYSLVLGSSVFLIDHFDLKEVKRIIENENINTLLVSPTSLKMIIDETKEEKINIDKIHTIETCGSILPILLVKTIKEINSNVKIYNDYGMTEVLGMVTYFDYSNSEININSIGKTISNIEIVIVDENNNILPKNKNGEILVKSSNMMEGYYDNGNLVTKSITNGYYHTGDMGYMDENDCIYISGRKDDLIVSGGENIYPKEIEDIVFQFQEIKEVAIVGAKDDTWGEHVKAFVSLKDGYNLNENQILSKCRDSMPHYKCPKEVVILNELPKIGSGKIDRKLLKTI